MSDDHPWYREPETFIAIAALVVSISAVVVGIYETSLQRAHDRAEVWPRLEVETFSELKSGSIFLENNGIGPGVVESVVVTVDGRPRRNWPDVVATLTGSPTRLLTNETAVEHALRPGDRVHLLSLDITNLPASFWSFIGRVGVTVCYRSVFGERWLVNAQQLGKQETWHDVDACPAQAAGTDF